MKIKEYFGENGITSTSANTVANLAKEYYTTIESKIKGLSAFSSSAQLISGEAPVTTSIGNDLETFNKVASALAEIAECKALCAYLRTAIKEREALFIEVENTDLPYNGPECPKREPYLIEEDIMATWPIKELERYLTLEAKCATLGQYIHEKGFINDLRKKYANRIQNPTEIRDNGRDTIIYSYTPSISQEELDKIFFSLQAEHRATESELNGMKHSIELALSKDKADKLAKYKIEYEAYNAAQMEHRNAVEAEKLRLHEEYSKYKIVIPDRLKGIYNKITHLNN